MLRILYAIVLCALLSANAHAASAKSVAGPPAWAVQNRPVGAPPLHVPTFDSIQSSVDRAGFAKVIVRFAAPAELPHGFQAEAAIGDKIRVSAQQAAIRKSQDTILGRVSKKHAGKAKRFSHIPYLALEVDAADLAVLLSSPELDAIEEDVPVPPSLTQTIPLLGGDSNGAFGGFTGAGQAVAILDTGVDKTHPFLAGKVVDEACYSSNYAPHAATTVCPNGQTSQTGAGAGVNCSSGIAGCDHGTHVAGIAAGNGAGFSGVAKDASVLAVQVFSRFDANCGSLPTPCALTYSSDYTSALDWVYSKRTTYSIAAVNMSLGGGSYTASCDGTAGSVKAAIDNLRAAGIATVIATGNNGYTNAISSPACISTAVSVGATTKADAVASYSNSATFFNLLAPGSSIYSSTPAGNYASWNGTSMATPHVTGAWAVMKSKKVTATVDEVLTAFITTGVSVTDSRNGIAKPRISLTSALSQISASSVTLSSDKASPQSPGTTVVFTASGSGGSGSYEYEFYLQAPGSSTWVKQQGYSTASTWSWNTTGMATGTYQVQVWMRNAGTSPAAGYDTFQNKTYVLSGSSTASGVTITSDKASPQFSGTTVTFTASGAGGTGSYQYQYWMKPPGGTWGIIKAYGNGSWTWNTTGLATGTYQIQAWVKTAGSSPPAGYDAYNELTYTLSTNAASGVTVVPDKASPQFSGTTVTFTASGAGGSGIYQYQYWMRSPSGIWSIIQPYGNGNTYTWNTAGLATGAYQIQAWVKMVGSSPAAGYDAYNELTYTLSTNSASGATITSDKASPQFSGTTVTFTATGAGGTGSYQYQYWMRSPSGIWSIIQPYGNGNTYTWNTTGLATGAYQIQAWVKTTGSSPAAGYDAYNELTYTLSTNSASGVTLVPDKASPQFSGTTVTFTATGAGGTGSYQYQYWMRSPSGIWSIIQPYGNGNTYTWNTAGLATGTYQVQAWVKTAGSSPAAGYDAYNELTYVLSTNSASGVTLVPDKASPQFSGTTVTFTATGAGGTGSYQYQYWMRSPSGIWSIIQPYGSGNTYTWNTAGLATGTYQIQAWVKTTGSSPAAGYDAYNELTYVLSTNAASGVTLVPDKASPQISGTSIVFTATGAGGTGSYQYQYWMKIPGGAWGIVQPYSNGNTWTLNTTGLPIGVYQIQAWVKSAGSSPPAGYDAYNELTFTINSNASSGVTIVSDKASPQLTGTTITFTATGAGGSGSYQYQFWLRSPSGIWSIIQPYGNGSAWTWNTAGYPAGAYLIQAWVKTAGSSPPDGYDAYQEISYTLN